MKLKSATLTLALMSILLATFTITPVVSEVPEAKPGPNMDEYYAVKISDPYAQPAALRADEVQAITVPDYETALALQSEGYTVHGTVSSAYEYYDINVNGWKHPDPAKAALHGFPLNNTHFRRAISYLTGVDDLIATNPLFKGLTRRNLGWTGQLQALYYNGPDSPALERWPYLSQYLAEEFPTSGKVATDSAIHEMFLGGFQAEDSGGNDISEANAKANPAAIDHWDHDEVLIRTIEVYADTWWSYYIDMADAWAAGLESIGIHTTKAYAADPITWPKVWSGDYDIGPYGTAWSKPDPFIIDIYFASWKTYWNMTDGTVQYGCCNWRFLNDTEIDNWIHIWGTTLNETLAVESAWKALQKIASEAYMPSAFSWVDYSAYHPDLMGFQRSFMISDRGLGYFQLKWKTPSIRDAHNNAIKVAWLAEPLTLNPATQIGVTDSWILGAVTGGYGGGLGLTLQHPVTQEQKPWIAYDWKVETFPYGGGTGTKITYWLRQDVYWHDGVQFTADDVKFSLEYGKYNSSDFQGQSVMATKDLINVTVVDVDADGWNEAVVYESKTSAFYLSYIGFWGSMIPKHIWENVPDPTAITPWTMDNPNPAAAAIGLTYLVGNGPWAYHKGDWVSGQYVRFKAARGANVLADFFRSAEVSNADINVDSIVDIFDLLVVAGRFLEERSDPRYDIHADVTCDDIIDLFDLLVISGKYLQTW